jgi:adenosine kinase
MNIVLTGSIAFDYLMTFPGQFVEHILPDHLDRISLSFLVDSLIRRPGGIAANIAYTLALLGEKPKVMATVGEDFADQKAWLEDQGVDMSTVKTVPDVLTASFFVTTDQTNAQIASFFTGAMAHARDLSFSDLPEIPDLAVISPNDPQAMINYAHECCQMDIPYFYDPSQQIVRMDAASLSSGIKGCLALFTNDYEFELIEEKTGMDLDEVRSHTEFVVITRGEKGADIYSNQGQNHIHAVAPKLIKDPTGVGDAFRAGFLKGHLHQLGFERCGQMGALAATYCLEADGPQGHKFDLPMFIERFRHHFDDHQELDQLL